jgi:hypothetical protein
MARDKRLKLLIAARNKHYADRKVLYTYIKDFVHSAEKTAEYEKKIQKINEWIAGIDYRINQIRPINNSSTLNLF